MRMRLTPDAEKMVISTGKGALLVIHDIDLDTMAQDLAGRDTSIYLYFYLSIVLANYLSPKGRELSLSYMI